ncbi:zinc finger protein CONSTANS-LIKE 10-like [Lotus japonicus]|uniref:zinc finger protein CONSTANS-LIKE 10-like n=1 Tax=Lotus japonicus TaxID=34305 RepID=UPI002590751C|nr:zinc finger protein CONSTANS-LIKE 10-like [Lotus japonicus]XP_057442309.1 zinc finger protein CONSTANS-LIKE 10-like [Lotus japonicus]XP_057442310.1 zinc finger protein CONSTANS-LIKE 10-like [Lotus japonicus]XP_057442311.1 zinc finger protein CONSTANS-LIKE 10-like [Lotus japonicus]XP_057442312.1 zinc finger protein CONSTANS-LIKE 10-like [Lotus japonicus]
MGYLCDFCGEQRSSVYCRSDVACLCLSCDRNVHSANALSKRHARTLVCERCNSQPAYVRCADEKVSLCQNCDWLSHGAAPSSSTHKRQSINCYSGCPSAAELSSMWSFFSDIPSIGEACEKELGLMSINENTDKSAWVPPESENVSGSAQVTDLPNKDKSWVGTSSAPESSSEPRVLEQAPGPANECMPKLHCPAKKTSELCEDDTVCDDFNIDEMDLFLKDEMDLFSKDEMDLELENYEELFGMALCHSEELFENGGIGSLFEAKDISASAGDSNCQGALTAEGSSVALGNAMKPACSTAASADSMLSTKTEPIISFAARQSQSNISFSGAAKDSSTADYQDCGASSMLPMGEPPWCPPFPESSLHSANRSNAVMRYKEKKKNRKFDKRVRYATRKARADVRKRVKGRFVKAGDVYDYDPLSETRSY